MRKYFNLASLFSMLLLVCCSGSVNGSIPDFSIGEESFKPTDEKPIILSYVWHSFKELPDPTLVTHINYAFGHLDKTNLTVIRPLIYMRESEVIGFVHKYQIPVVKSPCPADGHTRREYVKELLGKLNRENPGVKDRIFTAIQKGNMEGWTDYFGSH